MHITAGKCFRLNKPYAKCASLSSSFASLTSHKLGRCNASQTLRARCVVGGGGELVVRYGPFMVGRMMVIVAVVASIAHNKYVYYKKKSVTMK